MDSIVPLILMAAALIALIWWLRRRNPSAGKRAGRGHQALTGTSPIIVCTQGPLAGRSFQFRRGWMTFGRNPDNDVIIDGSLVSRNHAMLIISADGLTLRDLDSTNGTWVAGRRIMEHPLAANETYQIGPCVFAVVQPGAATPQAPSRPPINVSPPPSLSPSLARSVEINAYERGELIGEGGAAYVYRMRHRTTDESAALKVLKESADPYFKHRFADEGMIGLQLSHANIVKVLDAGDNNGIAYILMEYLSGGSLRERLATGVDLATTIVVIGQICQALDTAHAQGVFHRDIKPENILFTGAGVAKLGDFGIARLTGMRRITLQGMIVGTPEYMSFEQAKGHEHDSRSDQYSLGVVAYEMLTGRPPFIAPDPLAVVEKHLSEKPVPVRRINPGVPAQVESAVMRTLNKDKQRRFPTMNDMAVAMGYSHKAPSGILSHVQSLIQPRGEAQPRLVNLITGQSWPLTLPAELGRPMLGESTISGRHAVIRRHNNTYTIQDLNSRNGTFVEGASISSITVLSPGARIHLGPVPFQFIVDESPISGRRLT